MQFLLYLEAEKVVLVGKLIVINTYLKKKERSKINDLTLYLKKLENEEQNKLKFSSEGNNKNQSRNKE